MPAPLALFTCWLPPLLWMCLIFMGSTDVLAGEHTSRFFIPAMHFLFGNHLSPGQVDYLHFLFRKCGHLCEYAVLCVLFWRALGRLRLAYVPVSFSQRRNDFLLAILLSAFCAASDEFHQSFVPSRTATVHDVVIDTVGALLGLALYLLAARRFSRRLPGRAFTPG